MSDLQCAATLLLGPLTSWPEHERVALTYDGRADGDRDALDPPARALSSPVDIADVLARDPATMAVLGEVADLHRGETVAVITSAGERVTVLIDGDGTRVTRTGARSPRP